MEPAKVQLIEDSSEQLDDDVANLQKQEDGKTEMQAGGGNQPAQQQSAEPTVSEDRYKNLQAAFTRSTQENANLKSDLTQLQAQVQQLTTLQQNSQQQQQQQQQAPKIDYSDLDKSAQDFEEIAPLVKHIKQLETTITDLKNQQVKTEENFNTQQQQTTQTAQATAQEMHNNRILAVHPDAFQLSGSADFQGWLARQPGYIQQAVKSGPSDDIINVLGNYKQQMQIGQQQQQQQNTANNQNAGFKPTAARVNSATQLNVDKANTQTFTRAQIEAMSEAEFLVNENAINEAMVAGLIK